MLVDDNAAAQSESGGAGVSILVWPGTAHGVALFDPSGNHLDPFADDAVVLNRKWL